jgi:hypothetical protein
MRKILLVAVLFYLSCQALNAQTLFDGSGKKIAIISGDLLLDENFKEYGHFSQLGGYGNLYLNPDKKLLHADWHYEGYNSKYRVFNANGKLIGYEMKKNLYDGARKKIGKVVSPTDRNRNFFDLKGKLVMRCDHTTFFNGLDWERTLSLYFLFIQYNNRNR